MKLDKRKSVLTVSFSILYYVRI